MTSKERRFVNYYLGKAKGNGTLAARLAGYDHPRQLAVRLLSKVNIREAIESTLVLEAMDAAEVLSRLADRARSGAGDFLRFDPDAGPDKMPALDLRKAKRRGQLGNIKKLKTSRAAGDDPLEVVEVEIHDSLPALALLAKYHGLTTPRGDDDRAEAPPRIAIPDSDARPEAHAADGP